MSDIYGSSSSDCGELAAPASVARLEHYLDAVLKQTLADEVAKQNELVSLVANCTQLQRLFDDMKSLAAREGSRNTMLVNLGNHFYSPALVTDSNRVLLNIGCGVVLEMDKAAAVTHLAKREAYARSALERRNLSILRTKYKIRLVTEAIKRLHHAYTGAE